MESSSPLSPRQSIGYVALLVRDYDEAIAWFCGILGFHLIEDTPVDDKRWVLVAPPGSHATCLLLARAATPEQERAVGRQTGGRVFLFLHTDDFWRDYEALRGKGVRFRRDPREESYGTVAVFEDLYGNWWDLLELRSQRVPKCPDPDIGSPFRTRRGAQACSCCCGTSTFAPAYLE